MKPTYSFVRIIWLIGEIENDFELWIIDSLIQEEKKRYPLTHLDIMMQQLKAKQKDLTP